ncbi:protein kinase [Streptomyces sp. NPDC050145]|uniref:protein kinase domain-containing protein n=1 Tax=Streptomyces sp. NPDC050145 TaxID=3365602 RepID=UPI0037B469B0
MRGDGVRGHRLSGRYELVEVIGAGGMGEVWRARDLQLDRDVAVKVLKGGGDGGAEESEALARFRREALVAAALDSPYVVAVHDHGIDGTRPYLVMALVAGRTVQEILRDEVRVSVADALAWTADVCRGLDVAHRAGVVHRDIKPANIMVSEESGVSRARIVDFGIARYVAYRAADPRLTHTGQLPFGSVQYMAPERFRDGAGDASADLYAVGCVLYELLVGRPPFVGDAAGVMFNHLNDVPLRPSRARAELTPAVDRLVLDLMAKEPGERPADAREALERVLAARPGTKPAPTPVPTPAPAPKPVPVVKDAVPVAKQPEPAPAPEPVRTPVSAWTPAPPAPRRSRRGPLLGVAAALLVLGVPTAIGLSAASDGEDGVVETGPDGPPPVATSTAPLGTYTIGLAVDDDAAGATAKARERTVRAALDEARRRSKHKVPLEVVTVRDDQESAATFTDRHPSALALIGDIADFDDLEAGMPVVNVCRSTWAAEGVEYGVTAPETAAGRQAGRYLRGAFGMERVMDISELDWTASYSGEESFGIGLRASGLTADDTVDGRGTSTPDTAKFLKDLDRKRSQLVVVSDLPSHDDEDRIEKMIERGTSLAVRDAYANACDTPEDRAMFDRNDAQLPDGSLRFRAFNDERQKPDCADFPKLCSAPAEVRALLKHRGTAELYDTTLAVAAAVDRALGAERPAVEQLDMVRAQLRTDLDDVEVDGLLGHYAFKGHRAQDRPVWVDRRVKGSWKQLGTVEGLTGGTS